MVSWEHDCAELVSELLPFPLTRQCPGTLAGWIDRAERFGIRVRIATPYDPRGGMFVNGTILLSELPTETLKTRIAHELAEYLLRTESQPEYRYQSPLSHDQHCHRIAQLVEKIAQGQSVDP